MGMEKATGAWDLPSWSNSPWRFRAVSDGGYVMSVVTAQPGAQEPGRVIRWQGSQVVFICEEAESCTGSWNGGLPREYISLGFSGNMKCLRVKEMLADVCQVGRAEAYSSSMILAGNRVCSVQDHEGYLKIDAASRRYGVVCDGRCNIGGRSRSEQFLPLDVLLRIKQPPPTLSASVCFVWSCLGRGSYYCKVAVRSALDAFLAGGANPSHYGGRVNCRKTDENSVKFTMFADSSGSG